MSRERAGFAVGTDAAIAETPAERMSSELTVTVDDKSIIMKGLNRINLIFGKNGCGKSRLLHAIQKALEKETDYVVNFIKSERGERGMLHVELDESNEEYVKLSPGDRIFADLIIGEEKRRSFRGGVFYTYNSEHLRTIVGFLDNVEVFEEEIPNKYYGAPRAKTPSEAISTPWGRIPLDMRLKLGFWTKGFQSKKLDIKDLSDGEIEIIYIISKLIKFFDQIKSDPLGKNYIILIDELDVRLHPDVQYKIANFILKQVEEIAPKLNLKIFITTHSTSILSALAESPKVSVCFMRPRSELLFEPLSSAVSNIMKDILPIFGAHPLSQVFNESPILLVEGSDEERIWQQAIRTSNGKLKLYPRETGGKTKGKMREFENTINRILPSIYDHPIAYSLRDRDDIEDDKSVSMVSKDKRKEEGEDVKYTISRLRLHCRASENLLLSDEVIALIGNKYKVAISWSDVKAEVEHWLSIKSKEEKENPRYKAMVGFAEKFDRKLFELKKIRNTFLQIIEDTINRKKSTALGRPLSDEEQITVNTDWEILVGQTIGKLALSGIKDSTDKDSIINYLGPEVVNCLRENSRSPSESASAARCERGSRPSTAANPQRLRGRSTPAATVDATTSSTLAPTSGGAGTT